MCHGTQRPAPRSPRALLQQAVKPAKPVVRDPREEVVGDVHVLAVNENRPAGECVGEKYACVRQAARIGVGVLVNIAQQHEIHERSAQRQHPEQENVNGGGPGRRDVK
jgi:hypothetical protein